MLGSPDSYRDTGRTADIHRGVAIMLSRIHAAQVCDATEDHSSNFAGIKKNYQ